MRAPLFCLFVLAATNLQAQETHATFATAASAFYRRTSPPILARRSHWVITSRTAALHSSGHPTSERVV